MLLNKKEERGALPNFNSKYIHWPMIIIDHFKSNVKTMAK